MQTPAAALITLGRLAFLDGDQALALDLCSRSVRLARPLGDRWLLGIALTNLAESIVQAGDFDMAERLLYEAMGAALELGAQGNVVGILESLAGVYVEQHRVEQAVRVLGATDAYRSGRGLPLNPPGHLLVEAIVVKARTEAGPVRFGLAWESGRALTLTQVVRELRHLGQDGSEQALAANPPGHSPSGQVASSALNAAPWS